MQLNNLGIHAGAYSIGSLADGALVLMQENDQWHCFFFERGNRITEVAFADWDTACCYFLGRLIDLSRMFYD